MKASELIKELERMIAEHGDREVYAWMGDESYGKVSGVEQLSSPPSPRDDPYQIGDFCI